MAVYTSNENIDPIGSCVGPKGSRVKNVVDELNGEMIDIILWNSDPVVFISNALSPSEVKHVSIDEEKHSALVIVPDDQLSLAIGKRGQNARLAVRLTGWKIDIKSLSEAKELGLIDLPETVAEPETLVDDDFEKEFAQEMMGESHEEEIVKPQETTNEVVTDSYDDDYDDFDDYDDEYSKYDEEIDYDEYDKYYDDK